MTPSMYALRPRLRDPKASFAFGPGTWSTKIISAEARRSMMPKRARCGGLGTTSALRSLFSHAELCIDAKSAVASSAPHPFESPQASYVRVLPLRHDGECPSDL